MLRDLGSTKHLSAPSFCGTVYADAVASVVEGSVPRSIGPGARVEVVGLQAGEDQERVDSAGAKEARLSGLAPSTRVLFGAFLRWSTCLRLVKPLPT